MKFRDVTTEIEEKYEVDNERLTHNILEQYTQAYKEYELKRLYKDIFEDSAKDSFDFENKLSEIASSNIASPGQIWIVTSELVSMYNDSKIDNYSNIGLLISNLITESYNAGHNDFKIKTDNLKAIRYQYDLKTSIGRPLIMEIKGNVSSIYLQKHNPNYLNLTIDGRLEDWVGENIINSKITINGELEERRFLNYNPMYNCLIRTKNEEIYQALIDKIDGKKNKVQLIDEKENIIKEKKKSGFFSDTPHYWAMKEHRKNVRREFFSKIKSKLIK